MMECRCEAFCLPHQWLTRMLHLQSYVSQCLLSSLLIFFLFFSSVNICRHLPSIVLTLCLGVAAGERAASSPISRYLLHQTGFCTR